MNKFWKEKTLWKVNFWYQWIIHLISWCNKGSCWEHITGGVNIYLYVLVCWPPSVLCVFVFACAWHQIRVPVKNYIKCQTSVTHIEVLLVLRVPRLDMHRSILSLSNIAHQMWHDQSFNQPPPQPPPIIKPHSPFTKPTLPPFLGSSHF